MPTGESQIQAGFFPDFYDPTMLIWGHSQGLHRFATVLRDLPQSSRGRVPLNDLSWLATFRATRIWLELADSPGGMRKISSDEVPDFLWRLTESEAHRFATLVDIVAGSAVPCHHYLDADGRDDVAVLVSLGEYDGLQDELE